MDITYTTGQATIHLTVAKTKLGKIQGESHFPWKFDAVLTHLDLWVAMSITQWICGEQSL